MITVCCAAMFIGVLSWFMPWHKWPRQMLRILLPVALFLISSGVAYAGEFFAVYGVYFCVIFVLVGIVFPRGSSLTLLPLFAVASVVPVYLRTGDIALAAAYTVLVGLVSVVVGETLAWVTFRLRRSQVALWRASQAVGEVSADLVSMDPEGLAWSAASKLSKHFDAPRVVMYRLEDPGRLTRLSSVADGRPDLEGRHEDHDDLTTWPEGQRAAATREPVNEGGRLVLPLIARDRVIGLIEMEKTTDGATFSDEKVETAEAAVRLVALSIQDAETLRASQALATRLESLLASSRAVANADTLEEALANVTRCGAELLSVSDSVAYEYMEELEAIIPRAVWEASPSGWDGLGQALLLAQCPAEAAVLAAGQPLLENISDPALAPASREVLLKWGEKSCLTLPMVSADGSMGLLTFWDKERERQYSAEDMAVATGLAELAGERIRSTKLLRRLERLSTTDPVTGLANHRQIHEVLAKEQARSGRSGSPFSVVMVDLDEFKLLNDTHGHPCGDEALRHVSGILMDNIRATDIVGRYGGDEFVLVLPGTDPVAAGVVVENLRSAANDTPFVTPGGDRIPIRMSFGIAGYPRDAYNVNELMVAADANLYVSKRKGGNVVTGAAPEELEEGGREPFGFLESMVTAVDNKDSYTRRHSDEVTTYSMMIAEALGLSEGTLSVVRVAGLLHDVGKIGIPDRILRKPGRLTSAEYDIVKSHPAIGESLIRAMPDLEEIRAAVLTHHEHFAGSGYPQGLAGSEIPLVGRILCVADSYSAMTTDRPYRKALAFEEAVAELEANAGTQFDPAVVAAFIQCLRASRGQHDRSMAASALG